MENKLLKELYDHFYTRPELDEQENEVETVSYTHLDVYKRQLLI